MQRPIWVIEDGDEDFSVLSSSLRLAGVNNKLIRSGTGREVADYLREARSLPSTEIPILVLLDLNIPGGDGRSVLPELRAHPALKSIPIVVLTTSSQPTDVEKCYRLGASGYLTKPVDLDHFENMIRKMSDYWLGCVQLPRFPQVQS